MKNKKVFSFRSCKTHVTQHVRSNIICDEFKKKCHVILRGFLCIILPFFPVMMAYRKPTLVRASFCILRTNITLCIPSSYPCFLKMNEIITKMFLSKG